MSVSSGFSLDLLDLGGGGGGRFVLPYGGTSAGRQSVNGRGLMRGNIDLMGDLTLIDYIIN